MSHWGVPGPGGSLGKCAICGEDFAGGTIKSLFGMDSGILSFRVGFIDDTLYAHSPKCVEAAKAGFASDDPVAVRDSLPEGPLRTCLAEVIEKGLLLT